MNPGIKFKLFLMFQLFFVFVLVGCKAVPEKSREVVTGKAIDAFMSQYNGGKTNSDIQNSDAWREETRLLPEASAEGGEIVRYTGDGDQVLGYRITYYGETGKLVEHYYFIEDFIYYTSLLESYTNPISQGEVNTLSLVSTEGVIIDGICYEYNSGNHTLSTNIIKTSYTNLQQLNDLFESHR